MNCKYCSEKCVKAGFQKNGNQKYRCKGCKKYQQMAYCYHACKISKPYTQFISLHNEGIGVRAMGRIMKISHNTVLRWKLSIARNINCPKRLDNLHHYQVDELHTYVGSKKQEVWIKYVFDKTIKEVINFSVGMRTKENLRKLLTPILLQNPQQIGTDGLISYRSLVPQSIHKVGLKYTRHIERHNLNLRIHIKYLGRKTICFAKSITMLEASLKIYFWGNNSGCNIA